MQEFVLLSIKTQFAVINSQFSFMFVFSFSLGVQLFEDFAGLSFWQSCVAHCYVPVFKWKTVTQWLAMQGSINI